MSALRIPRSILAASGLLALPSLAHADEVGTLQLHKSGSQLTWAWVDGEPLGPLERGGLRRVLPEGVHEVWLAYDAKALLTACHGLVDVRAGEVQSVQIHSNRVRCSGLTAGLPDGPTTWRGATVFVDVHWSAALWLTLNNGPMHKLPYHPFSLNLPPGKQKLTLLEGYHYDDVLDQHHLTLQEGRAIFMRCDKAGCVGDWVASQEVDGLELLPHLALFEEAP